MRHYDLAPDSPLAPVMDLLRSVDRPGSYCTHGRLLVPMPRLEVAPAGPISFPIPKTQIRALLAQAERAPYGKGTETQVDTAVRDTWQIAADRVRLRGRAWDSTFGRILDAVTEGLGCPENSLAPQLYKLLVYEPGGFFAPHRDTEKARGMVATLVIALPTAGAGGTLVVRHNGDETAIDMHTDEPSEIAYAAFYADCTHEIQPVNEGHRICLVYNLILHGKAAGRIPPAAPDHYAHVDALSSLLADWPAGNPGTPNKIVWLLEYDYSEAGLSFAALKHLDATVGRMLCEAAERADCALHAAVVHVEQEGIAQYADLDTGGWGAPWDDLSDEMDEPLDDYAWLDGWVSPDGKRPNYGTVPLQAGELIPTGGLDDVEPDEKRIHEATGNEGATVEHVYHCAALVVWPRAAALQALARGGIDPVLEFAEMERARYGGRADAQERLGALAAQLVEVWLEAMPQADEKTWPRRCRQGLGLLGAFGNRPATMRFLRQIALPYYCGDENDALLAILVEIGSEGMHEFLPDLVRAAYGWRPGPCLDLVRRLCDGLGGEDDTGWSNVLQETARAACAALPIILAPPPANRPVVTRRRRETALDAGAIRDLFRSAWRLGLHDELQHAAVFLTGHPGIASPDDAVPHALEQLCALDKNHVADSAAVAVLWRHAAGHLLAHSETPPEAPRTWALPVRIDCDCEHCADLQTFCDDPVATERQFAVRQDLRAHLQEMIQRHRIDLRCTELRRGRPYRLACVKTRASYKRRLEQYGKEIEAMRRLVATAATVPTAAGATTRLRAAIARSQ